MPHRLLGGKAPSIVIPRDEYSQASTELSEVAPANSAVSADLEFGRLLGQGGCSFVVEARHRVTRNLYAVKVFNTYDKEKEQQLLRELITFESAACPCLVRFHGAFRSAGKVHMVLEHMDLGGLHDVLQLTEKCGPMPENVIAAIFYQVLWGLSYLHYERKLHRDIKPSNILMNRKGEVRLTDFGIATDLKEDALASTVVGTFRYMSPERLRGDEYGAAADVWSLGLVILELATGQVPFSTCNNQLDLNQLLEEVKVEIFIPWGQRSESLCEVLSACLHTEPNLRLPMAVLFDSPLFAETGIFSLDEAVDILREWISTQDVLMTPRMLSAVPGESAQEEEPRWKSVCDVSELQPPAGRAPIAAVTEEAEADESHSSPALRMICTWNSSDGGEDSASDGDLKLDDFGQHVPLRHLAHGDAPDDVNFNLRSFEKTPSRSRLGFGGYL
ncbi:kinase-like domain-containing protein [Tribonema minus]|uniref:mitogen-activated protein kinase kinase n=1 Tax=Tribonema minus TaxID=303371 RepID=A0A835YV97_9STRA|nr:kinase-like domain-containing protein [Tribonema minus]